MYGIVAAPPRPANCGILLVKVCRGEPERTVGFKFERDHFCVPYFLTSAIYTRTIMQLDDSKSTTSSPAIIPACDPPLYIALIATRVTPMHPGAQQGRSMAIGRHTTGVQ